MNLSISRIKHIAKSYFFVLRRSVLSPFYGIKIPFLDKKIEFGKCVKIGSGTRVYLHGGKIKVGGGTTICNFSKFIVGNATLEIGEKCVLGEYGIYNTFSDISIGNNVITADRVSFVSNIHHYTDVDMPIKEQPSSSLPIEIGEGTWLGMNATVLAGTKIGKNCVVAAHSVVKGEFPDYCVIAGVPGRIIKQYNNVTGEWEKSERRDT